jgi:hypothetical protein
MNESRLAPIPGVDWESRDIVCREAIEDDEQRRIFLDYLDCRAGGGKTKPFLNEYKIRWRDICQIYYRDKRLWSLMRISEGMGEDFRQKIREDEADRRAVEGVKKPVFYKGVECGFVREFSDQLLTVQLKAGNPAKYADHKNVRHSGAVLHLNIEGVEREDDEVIELQPESESAFVEDGDWDAPRGSDGLGEQGGDTVGADPAGAD